MCETAIALFDGPHVFGTVLFHKCSNRDDVLVSFDLHGMEPNQIHAVHIHKWGDTRDGCTSLGAHWNPRSQYHGSILIDPIKRHAGDLINNIYTDNEGKFKLWYDDNLISISDIYGRSVVIHDGIDDLGLGGNKESLETGNAGGRMACAIIGRAKPT